MTETAEPRDPAAPLTDSERDEDWALLGSVLPVIPPDQTPGIEGVRSLEDGEVVQFEQDAVLLTAIAGSAPYRHALSAYEAVQGVARDVAGSDQLSRRGQQRVLRSLAVFSRAMEALPSELTTSLRERLGEGPHVERLAVARAELESHPAYRLAVALDGAPADAIVVVSNADVVELAIPASAVGRWRAAAGADAADIGLLGTASSALAFSQRLMSRWILEHAETINEASRRIARMGGEITCGRATVFKFKLRVREGADPVPTNVTMIDVPIAQVHAVQATLRQAARLLDEGGRRPALRGGQGVRVEQVAAMLGETGVLSAVDRVADGAQDDQPSLASESGGAAGGGGTSRRAMTGRPTDMESLIAHMELGRKRAEDAWSRAFADDDIAVMVGEWGSLVNAAGGWLARSGTPLGVEAPEGFSVADAVDLSLDPDSPRAAEQARAAQAASLAAIEAMVSKIGEPTQHGEGEVGAWISSGAFAALRDQLELLAYLSEMGNVPGAVVISMSRAVRAARRGDPEAVLLHVSRAIHAATPGQLQAADPVASAVFERTTEAASRLAAGEQVDYSAVSLLASAALSAAVAVAGLSPRVGE